MKYIVSNIDWDTDGENIDLPTTLEVEVPDDIQDNQEKDEFISDKISDITGFCHKGYSTTPELIY